jgi:hypothetical protein
VQDKQFNSRRYGGNNWVNWNVTENGHGSIILAVEIRKLMLGQLKVDKNEVTAILSRR